jgi:hypothetical protein
MARSRRPSAQHAAPSFPRSAACQRLALDRLATNANLVLQDAGVTTGGENDQVMPGSPNEARIASMIRRHRREANDGIASAIVSEGIAELHSKLANRSDNSKPRPIQPILTARSRNWVLRVAVFSDYPTTTLMRQRLPRADKKPDRMFFSRPAGRARGPNPTST